MYRKFITPLYFINMTVQALVSLIAPIGLSVLFAWLIDKYTAVGPWIYVVFIMGGVLLGLYSMISFIIKAGRAIEALEKQHEQTLSDLAKKQSPYEKKNREENNEQKNSDLS